MDRFLQSLGVAAWAFRAVVGALGRARIWLPFLIVAGVQGGVLLLLVHFHRAALLPLGEPLVRWLGGEGALHYPSLYYALPGMFFRANLIISALIASIAGGVATLLFAHAFGLDQEIPVWKRALRCGPKLIVVTLVMVVIIFGIAGLASLVPAQLSLANPTVRWGTRAAMMVLFIAVQSFFAYTTAWIVLMGHRLWPAMRDSFRVTGATLLPTLTVVAIPTVLLFPLSYASGRVDFIASHLRPETIGGLVGLQLIGQILLTFLLVGAVTRLFLWRMEASR